jgi:glucose-6-phosphate isomerase
MRINSNLGLSNNLEIITKLNSISLRISAKDYTIWGENTEAKTRMGWVDLPTKSRDLLPQLDALSAWARSKNLTEIVLCGMGGSSLAPEVIAATYGKKLTVLDSTDPAQILSAAPKELARSIIIFGSKSGTTIETKSHFAFFVDLFTKANLLPTDHIVIITDPSTSLDEVARSEGYRVINANPDVGGRFSALSAFGLVPAALIGVDISVLLDDAQEALATFNQDNSPASVIAALLFTSTEQIVNFCDTKSQIPGLSDWIEQLIAESTGKNQVGRLPVVIESSESGGDNLTIGFTDGDFDLIVQGTLGEHFILWEWVTALLCYLLKVDPFNQPNVTEAKDRTSKILAQITENTFEIEKPVFEDNEIAVYSNRDIKHLSDFLQLPINYFAVMAYLTRGSNDEITKLRSKISKKTGKPTTFGWGPRFLHSTGQFHKGGQQNGAFIQITADSIVDVDIPNQPYTFAQLIMAQALGDAKALTERDLPLIRLHLKNRSAGITKLLADLD